MIILSMHANSYTGRITYYVLIDGLIYKFSNRRGAAGPVVRHSVHCVNEFVTAHLPYAWPCYEQDNWGRITQDDEDYGNPHWSNIDSCRQDTPRTLRIRERR